MQSIRQFSRYALCRTFSGLDPLFIQSGKYLDRHPAQEPINQKIEVDFKHSEIDAHPNIEGEWGGTQNKGEVPTVNGAGEITPGEPE